MDDQSKLASLRTLSINLLTDALKEIESHRESTSPQNVEHFLTAEYLLQEAIEHVTGSWDMLISNKPNASIALSRWSLEAALNLLWTVADRNKIDDCLKTLVGEALRLDACLLEGLSKLRPEQAERYRNKAQEARSVREGLDVEKPKDLNTRLEHIKQPKRDNWPELYPLYRICCSSAHPGLKVWERFGGTADSVESKNPIEKQSIARWMAAASTLYLVTNAFCLTELGSKEKLGEWWSKQVAPLL